MSGGARFKRENSPTKARSPARLEVRTSPAVEEPSNTESHLKSEAEFRWATAAKRNEREGLLASDLSVVRGPKSQWDSYT